MLYIDTSILVAYYYPERQSHKAESFITGKKMPAISHLTQVEFFSVIAKKIRERELSFSDAQRIKTMFLTHIAEQIFKILPVEIHHYHLARDWVAQFKTPLRTLDALHLSLAATNDIPLITADARLAKSAKMLGIKVKI